MKCIICFENKGNCLNISKWTCKHTDFMHSECVKNVKKCPLCRNSELYFDKLPDLPYNEYYKYKDAVCIKNNHEVFIKQPFGVLVICRDCSNVEAFNYK